MESPSSYPAPAVPVISATATSTVTSSLVRSSGTMDVFPTYAGLSGLDLPTLGRVADVPGYLPMTSPVMTQRPEGPVSFLGLETPTLEEPGSLDSFPRLLQFDPNAADLMQLALPLVPLAGDLQILADTALGQRPVWTHLSPQPGPRSSIVFLMSDLFREGPFDPYCAPADTGNLPLTPTDMPGCRYGMTFYESADVADVDPAYGLQLHHPRFLEFVWAPESDRLLTRT